MLLNFQLLDQLHHCCQVQVPWLGSDILLLKFGAGYKVDYFALRVQLLIGTLTFEQHHILHVCKDLKVRKVRGADEGRVPRSGIHCMCWFYLTLAIPACFLGHNMTACCSAEEMDVSNPMRKKRMEESPLKMFGFFIFCFWVGYDKGHKCQFSGECKVRQGATFPTGQRTAFIIFGLGSNGSKQVTGIRLDYADNDSERTVALCVEIPVACLRNVEMFQEKASTKEEAERIRDVGGIYSFRFFQTGGSGCLYGFLMFSRTVLYLFYTIYILYTRLD